jgi:Prenyltransferase and squalene oxidase repeat
VTAHAPDATAYSNPVEALKNAEVRKYFLALLRSEIPAEEKYETVIRFFEIEIDLAQRLLARKTDRESGNQEALGKALAEAAKEMEAWQPELILEQTEDGLRHALNRAVVSQHRNGGWGYSPGESHVWATAWTVLLLHEARRHGFDGNIAAISRGQQWLVENRRRWSLDQDEVLGNGNSVFEAAMALRCLFATGAASQPAVSRSIELSIARLLDEQKSAGNWEPTFYARTWTGSRELEWPDVAATSFALQALAAAPGGETARARGAASRAIDWLIGKQNEDGSWNAFVKVQQKPSAVKSVNKTSDVLRGFQAAQRLGIDVAPHQERIGRAVRWMLGQEEAVFKEGRIMGWAWKTEEKKDEKDETDYFNFLENTCLSLDTLLDIRGTLLDASTVSLPQLASNALWLLRQQHRADGDPDDGKWPNDDTGRIAFPLLRFYSQIRNSPAFDVAPAIQAEPEPRGQA